MQQDEGFFNEKKGDPPLTRVRIGTKGGVGHGPS